MAKLKNILRCTGVTILFWALAKLAPSFILSFVSLGSQADTLLFLLFLPIGWAVSQAASKRMCPSCIRANLYILAAIEITDILFTFLILISDSVISTGRYSTNSFGVLYSDYFAVYVSAFVTEAIYIALCFFLVKLTVSNASPSGKPQSSEDPPAVSLPEQQAGSFSCPAPSPEVQPVSSSVESTAEDAPPEQPAPIPEAPPSKAAPKHRPTALVFLSVLLTIALLISIGFNIYLAGNYDRGYEAGRIDGTRVGFEDGFNNGFSKGKEQGRPEGYEIGLSVGLSAGRIDCLASLYSYLPVQGSINHAYDALYIKGTFDHPAPFYSDSSAQDAYGQVYDAMYAAGEAHAAEGAEASAPQIDAYQHGYSIGYSGISLISAYDLPVQNHYAIYYTCCDGYIDGFLASTSEPDPDLISGFMDGCLAAIRSHLSENSN